MKKFNPIYLSVVLSTYNDEKYIAESIQSILNQSYPYFEFIIVNDGSKDGTLDIIKSFDDARIVLIDKPNTGLIDSLNTGVRTAKYEWIARMDGDDVAEPNRFEEEVKLIKEGVAVISSQCNLINNQGVYFGKTKFPTSKSGIRFFIKTDLNFPIAHPSVIFYKPFYLEVGGYDPLMQVAEDIDLWMKISCKGELVICDKFLLNLRKHAGNISSTKAELQILHAWVAYAKYIYGIHRPLTEVEFNKIKHIILYGWAFNTYKNYREVGKIGLLYRVLLKNIFTRTNTELKKYMIALKNK